MIGVQGSGIIGQSAVTFRVTDAETEPLEGSGSVLIVTVETQDDFLGGWPLTITGQANEGLIPLSHSLDLPGPGISSPAPRSLRRR